MILSAICSSHWLLGNEMFYATPPLNVYYKLNKQRLVLFHVNCCVFPHDL